MRKAKGVQTMNRAMRRKADKDLRSKLTNQQYKDFKNKAIEEYIQEEIKKGRDKTTEILSESLQDVLSKKEYRISESRRNCILDDFIETLDRKVQEVKGARKNERLS